jgi:hypothetical protein
MPLSIHIATKQQAKTTYFSVAAGADKAAAGREEREEIPGLDQGQKGASTTQGEGGPTRLQVHRPEAQRSFLVSSFFI